MAGRLESAHDEIVFVGTPNGLESTLVRSAGLEFKPLRASGFDRAKPWTIITSSVTVALSAIKAWIWMGRIAPDVVIGFGGYVSIPVGLAAVARGVPLVLHEQNSVPGLANRVLSRWARAVAVTYEDSASGLCHPDRVELTGNPVREDVLDASRPKARSNAGIDEGDLLLLVFGGSRGARHLNQAMTRIAPELLDAVPRLRVMHIAGRADADSVRAALEASDIDTDRWSVHAYVEKMGEALAAADVVIARAGATSIAEITARGLAAILVPYPYATDDHQTLNARLMVEHGAAWMIRDAELDGDEFFTSVVGLLEDHAARANMSAASAALGRIDAVDRVAAMARAVAVAESTG